MESYLPLLWAWASWQCNFACWTQCLEIFVSHPCFNSSNNSLVFVVLKKPGDDRCKATALPHLFHVSFMQFVCRTSHWPCTLVLGYWVENLRPLLRHSDLPQVWIERGFIVWIVKKYCFQKHLTREVGGNYALSFSQFIFHVIVQKKWYFCKTQLSFWYTANGSLVNTIPVNSCLTMY